MQIGEIRLRRIFDSRGRKTIQAECLINGKRVFSNYPSGASVGSNEAKSFPKPVEDMINYSRALLAKAKDFELGNQKKFDDFLKNYDGTQDFSKIGAIATCLSMLYMKASAEAEGLELYEYLNKNVKQMPLPLGNVLGGGKHLQSRSGLKFQEFLSLPIFAENFAEAVETNIRVYDKIANIMREEEIFFAKGDEGAIVADINETKALEIIRKVKASVNTRLGIDVAANSFYNKEKDVYIYDGKKLTSEQQMSYIQDLLSNNQIIYLEDPLNEEDFSGFKQLTKNNPKSLIVGDDLFTTKAERLKKAIRMGSCNAIIIKPNQAGTMTEVLKVVEIAKENDYVAIVSHRSGETEDSFISHLALGIEAPIIKTGVVSGERIAKLNELIRIEENLSSKKAIKLAKLKNIL